MKTSSVTLKTMTGGKYFKVTKLTNTMRFTVGSLLKEAEVKKLVVAPTIKVIIV